MSILSGLKSEPKSQKRWLDLAQRIQKRCQVWLVPKAKTLSYQLTISAPPNLSGEAKVFYRAPNLFRVETLVRENDSEEIYTFVFRDGKLWRREDNQPFVDVAEEFRRAIGERKTAVPSVGQLFEPLTFLRGVQVRFALDEVVGAPEKFRADAINEDPQHNCIQVVLSKPKEIIQAKAALGLQHFIRNFATSLSGNKAILCFHSETLQPLTEVILNEGEGQKTFRVVGIVSYKDFRDEPAPKRVDLTCIVGGWTWTLKMDFEWHAKKVWLLKQGEGWGEFLEPGLTKCEVEVSDVQVDRPLPDELFETR